MALTDKIINIANTIRSKTNTTEYMTLDEMAINIQNIKTEPTLQDKSLTITENGTTNIVADEGYDGLNSVSVTTSIDSADENIKIAPKTISFSGVTTTTIDGLEHLDTSNMTAMNSMFNACANVQELNLNNFNTSNVTIMTAMFSACKALTKLDLSSFDTAKVTNMQNMFNTCKALTHLDIRNFDFTKVTSYTSMFNSVPTDCEIIVKDDTAKTWITSKFTTLTNVKTVAELEAS